MPSEIEVLDVEITASSLVPLILIETSLFVPSSAVTVIVSVVDSLVPKASMVTLVLSSV